MDENLIKYSELYSALWRFLKKYLYTETEAEWAELHETAHILADKFADLDSQYANDLINATRVMIQRRYLERRKEAAIE